ncbi:MAG: hypothetical protein J4F28_07085 [Nitrosopumilaceae archaeon]|nr:hypothetical protein [Nitrosopumilaceae archaeon]
MERLARFALYLAMGIGITVFVLFLFSILPFIIENSWEDWKELDKNSMSRDEIYSKMTAHPAYLAMHEVYPDVKEEFVYRDRGSASLQVGVMSFETQNRLTLELYYHPPEDRINADVYCNVGEDLRTLRADGLFAEDFIRNVDCMEVAGIADGGKQATAAPVVAE